MILLHDLAESKIGDYTPGEITIDRKNKLENNATFDKKAEYIGKALLLQSEILTKNTILSRKISEIMTDLL